MLKSNADATELVRRITGNSARRTASFFIGRIVTIGAGTVSRERRRERGEWANAHTLPAIPWRPHPTDVPASSASALACIYPTLLRVAPRSRVQEECPRLRGGTAGESRWLFRSQSIDDSYPGRLSRSRSGSSDRRIHKAHTEFPGFASAVIRRWRMRLAMLSAC